MKLTESLDGRAKRNKQVSKKAAPGPPPDIISLLILL
jgi:hypothetical protein